MLVQVRLLPKVGTEVIHDAASTGRKGDGNVADAVNKKQSLDQCWAKEEGSPNTHRS